MAKATKIIIEFDDGTRKELDPAAVGSIFTSEARARKCGHNPPYNKPPKEDGGGDAGSVTLMGGTAEGGACYLWNGVIYCP
jgi:hypothetical protein